MAKTAISLCCFAVMVAACAFQAYVKTPDNSRDSFQNFLFAFDKNDFFNEGFYEEVKLKEFSGGHTVNHWNWNKGDVFSVYRTFNLFKPDGTFIETEGLEVRIARTLENGRIVQIEADWNSFGGKEKVLTYADVEPRFGDKWTLHRPRISPHSGPYRKPTSPMGSKTIIYNRDSEDWKREIRFSFEYDGLLRNATVLISKKE